MRYHPPMPTRYLEDSTPVVQFDPQLEVSPFALFRRLAHASAVGHANHADFFDPKYALWITSSSASWPGAPLKVTLPSSSK